MSWRMYCAAAASGGSTSIAAWLRMRSLICAPAPAIAYQSPHAAPTCKGHRRWSTKQCTEHQKCLALYFDTLL